MKRDKAMNIVRKGGLKSGGLKSNGLKFSRLKSVCLTLTVLTPAAACEQPFKAGFGPVVDTRPPTIVLDSPGAGMYLTGTPVFMGHAEDDYKLNSVFLRVTNYPDSYPLTSYQKVALVNGRWSLPIDTTQYDDGDFMIQLMVRDSLNKQVETDNIAFFVKNGPPLVRMVMPAIAHTSENPQDGETGGRHLNYDVTNTLPASFFVFTRVMDTKAAMIGTISDNKGINMKRGLAKIVTGRNSLTGGDIVTEKEKFLP